MKDEQNAPDSKEVDEDNPVIQVFQVYQKALTDRHDRHERIVKLSRDITIESKRAIFLLHRISGDQNRETVLTETQEKLEEIQQTRWRLVAEELKGQDPYRFLRAYSPGLQEYIEAVSFYHYQKHGSLITQAEVEEPLYFDPDIGDKKPIDPEARFISASKAAEQFVPVNIHIPPLEYVLGLADLTGELMRMAINSVGAGDTDAAFKLCSFMREIHRAVVQLNTPPPNRELRQKTNVLYASIKKVETACYTVQVRGSEIPKHMLTQALLAMPTEAALNEDG